MASASLGACLYCPFKASVASLLNKGGAVNFPVAVLQTISAFVIFVAGYLMLLVSIICALVLASCIYKGGQIVQAYTVRPCQALVVEGNRQRRAFKGESGKPGLGSEGGVV